MKINFDSLIDPIFLFIYWLVAGTLWVIIPLPPPAPAAVIEVAPPPKVEPLTPPPALEAALSSLTAQLDSLDIDLKDTQSESVAVENEIEGLEREKQRLQGLLQEAGQELEALSTERSQLEQADRLSLEERRKLEAKLEKELAAELALINDQIDDLRRRESVLSMQAQKSPRASGPEGSQILAPRAISPKTLPVLVEIYNNRISPVEQPFFEIQGSGMFARGPRIAQRRVPGETAQEIDKVDSAISKLLDSIDREKYYVSVLVNRDSFPAFRALRQHAWSKGYDVGWMPVDSSAGRIELYQAKFVKKPPKGDNLPEVAPIQK